jgi:hypothetical protein
MGLNILICINDTADDKLTQMVSSVEVYEKIDQNTTYKMDFMIDVCDGDIAQALQKSTNPGAILSVLASVDDNMVCLVKGPVTTQQEHLQHGGAGSWIHIEGEDTAHNMDLTVKFQTYDSATDADIVTKIISTGNKMTADVEATPDSRHDEKNHVLVQTETDLNLIRKLARRNGFHFWVTYTDKGVATGHFRPRNLNGQSTADLIVNLDTYNMDSLRVSADPLRPSQTEGKQLNLRDKTKMGGTVKLDDTVLGTSGLAAVAGAVQSMHFAPAVDDQGALNARSKGVLREAQWFINATCHTSLHRLCKIVRNHTIVSVVGAGSRHSGKYYVTGVRHKIDAADHNMDLELARNAWGDASGISNAVQGILS